MPYFCPSCEGSPCICKEVNDLIRKAHKEDKYYCCVEGCPGLPYKASEHPHPCGQTSMDEVRSEFDDTSPRTTD